MRFDIAIYNTLRDKALEEGAGQLMVALESPSDVSKFHKWLINCKHRDIVNKDSLGRFKFSTIDLVTTVTLTRVASTAYIVKHSDSGGTMSDKIRRASNMIHELPPLRDSREDT